MLKTMNFADFNYTNTYFILSISSKHDGKKSKLSVSLNRFAVLFPDDSIVGVFDTPSKSTDNNKTPEPIDYLSKAYSFTVLHWKHHKVLCVQERTLNKDNMSNLF